MRTDQGLDLHLFNAPRSLWKQEAQAAAFRERWRALGIGTSKIPKRPRADLEGLLGTTAPLDYEAVTALLRGKPHRE